MYLEEVVRDAITQVAINLQGLDRSLRPSRLDLFVPLMTALELEEHTIARTRDELPPNMPATIATLGKINIPGGTRWTTVHDVAQFGADDRIGPRALSSADESDARPTRKRISILSGVQGDRNHVTVHAWTRQC